MGFFVYLDQLFKASSHSVPPTSGIALPRPKISGVLACLSDPVSCVSNLPPSAVNEAGLINIDNIQLWAGFRGGGLADVDKVQLWLVLLSGWAANEERAAKEERGGRSREENSVCPG